jgi:hypothetical protein
MGFLSAIPVIGGIIEQGLGIVDDFVEDKDQANKLKAEIRKQIEAQAHKERQALIAEQGKIVTAEAKGESWLQRNWRPMLMLVVILIIANNYVFAPYLSAIWPEYVHVLELPSGLWALLNVGVGGYVGGRTVEKIKGKDKNG